MNPMLRAGRLLLAAFSLIAASAAMPSAAAQEPAAEASAGSPAALPSDLAENEIDALLARLPDDRVRALLLAELKAAARARDGAANAAEEEGLVGGVDAGGVKLKQAVEATVASLGAIPSTAADVYRRLTTGPGPDEGGPLRLVVLALSFAALIAAGAVVEAWYHRRTADIRARIAGAPPGTAGVRIGRGLLRAFLDLMALGAFALPVVVLFVVVEPPNETARMFVAAFFAAILLVRLASLVSRIVFAPAAPALRMVPAKDEDARYLHRRVVQVAVVWASGRRVPARLPPPPPSPSPPGTAAVGAPGSIPSRSSRRSIAVCVIFHSMSAMTRIRMTSNAAAAVVSPTVAVAAARGSPPHAAQRSATVNRTSSTLTLRMIAST